MKQTITTGIILSRIDYGEADRILTILTPDHGKLRVKARGVRKVKSKLAGGIELFSTSHITFIQGRGDGLGTLISTRLIKHYGRITSDIERVQLGYELIKTLDRTTEDHPEAEYYHLLEQAFMALDDSAIGPELIHTWFQARMLKLAGHTPNLSTDTAGAKLDASHKYNFDPEAMTFTATDAGNYGAGSIKVLRLLFSDHSVAQLAKVEGVEGELQEVAPLMRIMSQSFL